MRRALIIQNFFRDSINTLLWPGWNSLSCISRKIKVEIGLSVFLGGGGGGGVMHFCPGTITTHAETINSDLQRGLDRRLRHTQH